MSLIKGPKIKYWNIYGIIKKENEKRGINVNVDLKGEKKNDFEDNEESNLRYTSIYIKYRKTETIIHKNYS